MNKNEYIHRLNAALKNGGCQGAEAWLLNDGICAAFLTEINSKSIVIEWATKEDLICRYFGVSTIFIYVPMGVSEKIECLEKLMQAAHEVENNISELDVLDFEDMRKKLNILIADFEDLKMIETLEKRKETDK